MYNFAQINNENIFYQKTKMGFESKMSRGSNWFNYYIFGGYV